MKEKEINAGYEIIERFPVGEQGFAIGHSDTAPAPIPVPTLTPTSAPSVSPTATAKPSPTKTGDSFCTLTIGNTDIPVRYGVEEKTLEKSPGFLPSSALPGTEGTCAIYGHRNRNHFKVLKDAAVGDSIKVTMADGTTYTYSITDITIYESTSEWTLPVSSGKTLVLVTCYPFQYSGHAPGKVRNRCKYCVRTTTRFHRIGFPLK